MKRILFAAAIFVCSFQTTAFCQGGNDILNNGVSKIKEPAQNRPHYRKGLIAFDKSGACTSVIGDVVYFKAYVTMEERHEPLGRQQNITC